MSVSFHIDFNGQCEEAFRYYAANIGGTVGTLLRFRDSPVSSQMPESRQDKVVHANISIEGVELAGADVRPEQYEKPKGFYVLLGVDSDARVKDIYNALQRGGNAILPPQRTFWSSCYAIVIDQFGVPWKINCGS